MSNDLFNERTGTCIVCPVTRADRGCPFHVVIPEGEPVEGCVMVEQVKAADFRARKATRIGVAPQAVLDEALALLDACLY